jgi:hypothetical protein
MGEAFVIGCLEGRLDALALVSLKISVRFINYAFARLWPELQMVVFQAGCHNSAWKPETQRLS